MSTAAAVSPPFIPSSTPSSSSSGPGDVVHRLRKLDALLDLAPHELGRMYEEARAPRLGDVRGDLRGRMLAWSILDNHPRIAAGLRAFAGAKTFPWRGKSFKPFTEENGEGINRVFSDRFRLFRFETFIGPSRAGDFDALQLNYDLSGNPPVIRSIKDEMRELEPGLWLGQAYLRTRSRLRPEPADVLWLHFALARATG